MKQKTCEKCLESKPCGQYRRIRDNKAKTSYPRLCLECEPPLNRYVKKTCVVCNETGFSKEKFGGKDKDTCKDCVRKQKEEKASEKERNTFRRNRHNITQEDYDRMLMEQNNCCAICKKESVLNSFKRDMHIDHDHNCCPGAESCGNCIRALLCHQCNAGLGFFKDDIELVLKAAEYLKSFC